MSVLRAAVTQVAWTGDEESMVRKHESFVADAASRDVAAICFQELFHCPYFAAVEDERYFTYATAVDGPLTARFAALAEQYRMVIVLPIYEDAGEEGRFNSAVVIDADGSVVGIYRKQHVPSLPPGGLERFYFEPGNVGYPVFTTRAGRLGIYICYDRHFAEGWRALGLQSPDLVFNPSATDPDLSRRLWDLEQPTAAAGNGFYVGACNRVGDERVLFPKTGRKFYGSSYFVDARGNFVGAHGSEEHDELVVRDLDLDALDEIRRSWRFMENRRPESYERLVSGPPADTARRDPRLRERT